MFIETIYTPGLASLSYVIGDGDVAAVVDPRRDVEPYLEVAKRRGVDIRLVFETHRNEDFVVGSCPLAARTGASILHGRGLDFEYGELVDEGRRVELGAVSLTVLHTPGHTDESISIAARHHDTGDSPLAVFTGDALFVGDVGRTDFYPDRAKEVAGLLYDSLFDKILPLGDGCILHPAHGAGSVCGDGMADRNFSTLGHERRHNPMLQLSRADFIEAKLAEHHETPPYFERMEHLNRVGGDLDGPFATPRGLSVDGVAKALDGGGPVIDVRSPQAFAGSHVPGALCIPESMVPAYAGWLLPYETPLTFIADDRAQVERVGTHLRRLGYDAERRWLHGGITRWETSGRRLGQVEAISARRLREAIDDVLVLDVRKVSEYRSGHIEGARHVFLGRLPALLGELPRDRPIVTFCGSGRRALIGASILRQAGFTRVQNCFGSMKAWRAIEGPVVEGAG